MSQIDFEKLIAQCKTGDVDAKIEAVSGLQQAFEAGVKTEETDDIIDALKACLRSPNQHVYTASLVALSAFFPLLKTGTTNSSSDTVDVTALRYALTAFLPAGGLIDRLGDSRERVREKARESLVLLADLALRCGTTSFSMSSRGRDAGKGPETPLAIWERFLREGALQSKVWRVREQALVTLVAVRRSYSTLPLKPYLPPLVDLLEDTDGTVRECARQSIVELFTGSTVSDAARADLKKEMAKRGVRKTIVDSVIQKLMAGGPCSTLTSPGISEAGSENGETPQKREYIPPSLKLQARQATSSSIQTTFSRSLSTSNSLVDVGSRPESRLEGDLPATPTGDSGEVTSVYIASSKDLESELAGMQKHFEGKETEHNWAAREKSIIRIRGMLKGEAHVRYMDTFLAGLKNGMLDASFKTLRSLRTTVAVQTCNLYSELALALGPAMDSFFEPLLMHLLPMAALTKKISAMLSQQTLDTVITHLSPQPKMLLNQLWEAMQEKNISTRQYAISHLKLFLETHGGPSKHAIETSGSLDCLERCFKKALSDSNPAVRETARIAYWKFYEIWEERAAPIMNALDATAKKQLQKACPDPAKVVAPATPKVKKSSVAAAIAASRAKAKAIATAPPTLRHQATSASHFLQSSTSPTQRPPSRSGGLPKVGFASNRRSPPSRPLSPSSPPTRRIASFSPTSSSTMAAPSSMHSRTLSIDGPPSPSSHRRFTSYQLSPPSSNHPDTLETAAKTALPASPSNSVEFAAGVALPSSPPRHKERMPSPTRIPSPTRRSGIRASLVSLVDSEQPLFRGRPNFREESMLLAQTIPLPEDTDSEDESPMMSFSAPYEKYQLSMPKTTTSSLSAGSPPPNAPEPIVEDALRARAEQAESAAERLLELVEQDDDASVSPIPQQLLRSNGSPPRPAKQGGVLQPRTENIPSTPMTRKSAIFKQAAMFQDSPANRKTASMLDVLRERKHVTGWWVKRISLTDKGSPLMGIDRPSQLIELKQIVLALEDGSASVSALKDLALLSLDNPVQDGSLDMSLSASSYPDSPTPAMRKLGDEKTVWDEEKIFNRMFNALLSYLTVGRSDDELEYGLIALWEILEHQTSLSEGREADVFAHLLHLRFCTKINVLEATNTIRDALVSRIDSVYGLTTLHASLRAFYAEPLSDGTTQEIKLASYAFGLIALGKFILRLPGEILEDELPRLKATLTTALSEPLSLVVRESAATCIIAAQLVLRDETHLFTLLDGLSDEKKNLLTYLFDKHGARGAKQATGTERLEKEMRRLDGRTSTPPRVLA